jgi:hypothetical protein
VHGTFNGVRIREITSKKITIIPTGGNLLAFRVSVRVPPAFVDELRLYRPALLVLSEERYKGRIVRFIADVLRGYEVTIEIPVPG